MEAPRTLRAYAVEQAQETLRQSTILVEAAKRLIAHSHQLKGEADVLHRRHMGILRHRSRRARSGVKQ